MNDRDHIYTIPEFDISQLNEVFVQMHSFEATAGERQGQTGLEVESIETGSALFSQPGERSGRVRTWVILQEGHLLASCSCGATTEKLCHYQSRALYAISRRPELRVFFDPALRRGKLAEAARAYGLQREPDPGRYFYLEYAGGQTVARPVSPGLVPLDRADMLKLRDRFTAGDSPGRAAMSAETHLLLVFKQHKYYRHLNIELMEAALTQGGKPRNPLMPVNAREKIWRAATPEESKFFSAVDLFQDKAVQEEPVLALQALKAILKNPAGIRFYRHDRDISENVTAASIRPLQTGSPLHDLQLRMVNADPFYELSAGLVLNGTKYRLEEATIEYDYFLAIDGSLHLAGNAKLLEIARFMKKHQDKLLIHRSGYEDFRETVLSRIEESATIDYTYLPRATRAQLAAHNLDKAPEKLLYLADSGPYVELNPVMKYGNIEIPILSKKPIYPKSIRTGFRVSRDKEAETAFVSLLMKQHPYFTEQVEEGLPYFYLHRKHFLDEAWFPGAFEEWQNQGVRIFGFNKLKQNRLNPHKAKITIRVLSGTDWFNAEVDMYYGEKRASLKQLRRAVRNKSRYVQLDDGTLGILPEEWIEKFRAYFSAGELTGDHLSIPRINFRAVRELFGKERTDSPLDADASSDGQAHADASLDGPVYAELTALESGLAQLSAPECIPDAGVPRELQARLRDYQKQGLNWLNLLDDLGFGGCLADDMGLGKTLQILAFILLQRKKREQNTNLLVAPASLIFNWEQEIRKFAPSLQVLTLYGPDRRADAGEFGRYELIITSYSTLLTDVRFLERFPFNYVFADESQNIKNPDSQRHQAICRLKARNRIAITGTPVENNTFDLYGQLSFACPGLLGNKQYFKEIYAVPIDQFQDRKRAAELQEKVRPFILRRSKKQVAAELPEKTEMVLFCEMPPEQRKVYEATEREFREFICSKTSEELPKSSVHVLRGLTRLRQICNTPLLLNDEEIGVKESGKMEILLEQIREKSDRHKILVFSQFVSMLDLVGKELEARNTGFSYLTGSTRDRGRVVEEFQSDTTKRVFLISLKAGGTGLNLTEADYVYLIDPWWNPAVENQAIDRIYRIGQKKNVVAVRLICAGTIEEKMMQLQETKKELFDKLITKDSLLELLGQ